MSHTTVATERVILDARLIGAEPSAAIRSAWASVVTDYQDARARLDPAFERHGSLSPNLDGLLALTEEGTLTAEWAAVARQLFGDFARYHYGPGSGATSAIATAYVRAAHRLCSTLIRVGTPADRATAGPARRGGVQ